jgi:exonuclease SbcC
LVPSLSRVASSLLSEMTDGKRTKVEVDEDFEVTVDGQPVRTLSGSGISVVNLALRIALGQVLTQKVVPVFLADEIDHDMDAKRAEATHASLKKLTGVLDKVIVVTHKDIEGDHIIHLE